MFGTTENNFEIFTSLKPNGGAKGLVHQKYTAKVKATYIFKTSAIVWLHTNVCKNRSLFSVSLPLKIQLLHVRP